MTPKLTDAEMEGIEKRLEAATPGPWYNKPLKYDDWGVVRAQGEGLDSDRFWIVANARAGDYIDCAIEDEHRINKTDPYDHNANFIAHAPTDIAALLAEVRRLREENEQLRKLIGMAHELNAMIEKDPTEAG